MSENSRPPGGKPRRDRPWWLIGLICIGLTLLLLGLINPAYRDIFWALAPGLAVTLRVTAIAFCGSFQLGTVLAFGLLSHRRWLAELTRAWVEVMRGLPMLVVLYMVHLVATPAFVSAYGALQTAGGGWLPLLALRDLSFEARAILALILAYSSFIAEIMRGGILAVPEGQAEAAQALGLGPVNTMRLIILPQAFKIMMPPLGNDLVSLLKDSSLVSVLGVIDVTQLGKTYSAASFQFFQTYLVVAFYYLVMTISLSVFARRLEGRLHRNLHRR